MLLYKVPILKKRQSSKIRKKVVHNFDFLQRQTKEKLSLILKLENGNMWWCLSNTAIHLLKGMQNCSKEKFYSSTITLSALSYQIPRWAALVK